MIDTELLERLAGLARLGLSDKEQASLRKELESILAHFQAIQEVDTEGVEPLSHVLMDSGEPAADVIAPFDDARARLVPLSKNHREGFFVVPRVVEGPRPGTAAENTTSHDADPGDEDD
jgi:aspartyl-tRNA(Asn)/glutamyl-tRNA(Gln) amidotransferase subunit C